MAETAWLAGRRALITGGAEGFGAALCAGLSAQGAHAQALQLTHTSREGIHAHFDQAVQGLGGLDIVVHAQFAPGLFENRALCDTSAEQWEQGCEAFVRSAVFVLQACHRHLGEAGGRVVLVTPTVSTAGSAGLVPLSAAIEAVRVLAKAAAKQWGALGITINSLAPGLEVFFASGEAPRMALGEPALPGFDGSRDAASVLGFLASEQAGSLTGATLRVDGGIWTAG